MAEAETEIEITPAMIEAGAREIELWGCGEVKAWEAMSLAEDVLRASLASAGLTPPLSALSEAPALGRRESLDQGPQCR